MASKVQSVFQKDTFSRGGRGKFAIGASSPPTSIFRPVPLALSYVTIFEAAWLADVEKWHADDLNKT